jgi:threonine dehydrogenase-like Zn-dependent dehydrogenase
MKAVVFRGIGDIRLENVKEPKIKHDQDAIIRVTASAICGTDLHMVRGTMPNMKSGTILGHEAVGIIEEVGRGVRNLAPGDRVVVGSTISCGNCSYCRASYYSQCDNANPLGKMAATAFFGGPVETGGFDGLQAEYARIPFANVGAVKLPDDVSDDQAITISDIFPTGYFAADLAEIKPGDSVAVFGCGPVGQFAIASAFMMGASRVFAVDHVESRLHMARGQGAEVINFDREHPVLAIREATSGIGVDRAMDAVGVDAEHAESGPAWATAKASRKLYKQQLEEIAPKTNTKNGNWVPGNAPSLALEWAVESLAKAGTLSIVGVYPMAAKWFPIGMAMNRNLTIKMGNCPHRRYIPKLIDLVQSGRINPASILTQVQPLSSVIDAYKAFDRREDGWVKVELLPATSAERSSRVPRRELAGVL